MAQLGELCPADETRLGGDPPVAEWIDWWQRAGFCNGAHAGIISFALSPRYDDRRTGFPDDDPDTDFCGWFVLGLIENNYANLYGTEFRDFIAGHPDLGDKPAIATLLHALPDIYPCKGGDAGVYKFGIQDLRYLCTASGARLLRPNPESASNEVAVLYASYGYCQGVLYAWIHGANDADHANQDQGHTSYCLPSELILSELQRALIDELDARLAQDPGDLPVAAELDGMLQRILPCS